MKYAAAAAFLALISSTNAHDTNQHRRHADLAKRQAISAGPTSGTSTPASSPASSSPAPSTIPVVAPPPVSSSIPVVAPPPGTTPVSSVSGASGAIPLNQITSGMPSAPTLPASTTFSQGAKPTYYPGPGLPTPFVFKQGDWPAQDKVVDTTSPDVQEWMKELQGFKIPDIPPTTGDCAGSPNATANAAANGWWTCGGHTRPTDITACPDKMTWGVSFDDGPSPYTQTLLKYLDQEDLLATFFVVGSRVISYPQILVEEYMAGHEISVHTWSHRPLTSLTNEQIVGELGWTRKAIKAVLGVTPTTMRPPYGDIDDRVRAISLAMGMVPIIWTSAPASGPFDTNDWRVAGGLVTGEQSFATFESILGNASTLNTGFIVLQHDLYEITVDMATGYTLNAAVNHNPPFTLKPIGACVGTKPADLYLETNTNKTFPYPNSTSGSVSGNSSSSTGGASNSGGASSVNTPLGAMIVFGLMAIGATML